ncbi:MAG: hypothetical protein HC808_16910 [Candidatus Competibacteraceae bacterium]|nr:hypothetical protein [Candidatus Competibacteraceae bacterium]
MTTIGDILDEFFSPFSSEKLWIMPENDNYTKIVRQWVPVKTAVNFVKANLVANCATWSAKHKTSATWKPGKTDPPKTDPNAFGRWVASPPGTDPQTCKEAFVKYVASKVAGVVAPIPEIQTRNLYTCSIGSFGIYATVDFVDCAKKAATINIWMYNAMDKQSFGKFADDPVFALCGMKRQYMWWNWKEKWGNPPVVVPKQGPGGW